MKTPEEFRERNDPGPKRLEFYKRLGERSTAPLWEALARLVTPEPHPACVPALWRYAELRPLLLEAATLISAAEAERRVLVLENPGIRGHSQITQSLYAGLQLVMPGEIAPRHRHVASALRFVIESDGAYTSVDGVRAFMQPGDFVVTPSWTFHEHGNEGSEPAIWLDGLDVPIVNVFDSSFSEQDPARSQPQAGLDGIPASGQAAIAAIAHNFSGGETAFSFPYARSREALEAMARTAAPDPRYGFRLDYLDPATGRSPMPTIGAALNLLQPGFQGTFHRTTDATIYCCVEGRGRTRIGPAIFEWARHDVFVAPSWQPVRHEAESQAILFSFSDRPAQQALSLWREDGTYQSP